MMNFLFDDLTDFNSSKFKTDFRTIGDQVLNRYKNIPMVIRDEDSFEIEMPIPGYEKEDLEIDISDQVLIISGEANDNNRFATGFTKKFELPNELDIETCEAEVKAGILKITFGNKLKQVKKVKIN